MVKQIWWRQGRQGGERQWAAKRRISQACVEGTLAPSCPLTAHRCEVGGVAAGDKRCREAKGIAQVEACSAPAPSPMRGLHAPTPSSPPRLASRPPHLNSMVHLPSQNCGPEGGGKHAEDQGSRGMLSPTVQSHAAATPSADIGAIFFNFIKNGTSATWWKSMSPCVDCALKAGASSPSTTMALAWLAVYAPAAGGGGGSGGDGIEPQSAEQSRG